MPNGRSKEHVIARKPRQAPAALPITRTLFYFNFIACRSCLPSINVSSTASSVVYSFPATNKKLPFQRHNLHFISCVITVLRRDTGGGRWCDCDSFLPVVTVEHPLIPRNSVSHYCTQSFLCRSTTFFYNDDDRVIPTD